MFIDVADDFKKPAACSQINSVTALNNPLGIKPFDKPTRCLSHFINSYYIPLIDLFIPGISNANKLPNRLPIDKRPKVFPSIVIRCDIPPLVVKLPSEFNLAHLSLPSPFLCFLLTLTQEYLHFV